MSVPSKGKAAAVVSFLRSSSPRSFWPILLRAGRVLGAAGRLRWKSSAGGVSGSVAGGFVLALLVFPASAIAVPIAYPDSGTTVPLYFFWRGAGDLDPASADHVEYYDLQKTPIFGPLVWADAEPSDLPFANVCISFVGGDDELRQWCWTFMADRRARYRVRACTGIDACRDWVEVPPFLKCCRTNVPEPGSAVCYGGLAQPPADCS